MQKLVNKKNYVFKSANNCTFVQRELLKTDQFDVSLPNSIFSLLQDFEDVFLKEIPHGLPYIHGIEYPIDFIQDAAILYRSAYQSNPEEIEAL